MSKDSSQYKTMRGQAFLIAAASAVLLGGCSKTAETPSRIHVLVAASASAAVQVAADVCVEQIPSGLSAAEIIVVSGSSSGLARQIESGAPADIFLSAKSKWTDAIKARSIDSHPLFRNRLVLATHQSNPAQIENLTDLTRPKAIATQWRTERPRRARQDSAFPTASVAAR